MTISVGTGAIVTMGVVSPFSLLGAALLTLAALSFLIDDKHLPQNQNKAGQQVNATPPTTTALVPPLKLPTTSTTVTPLTSHRSTSNASPRTPSNSSSTNPSLVALFNPGKTPSPSPSSEYVLVGQTQ